MTEKREGMNRVRTGQDGEERKDEQSWNRIGRRREKG